MTTGVAEGAEKGSYLGPGEHELPRNFASQGDPHCAVEYYIQARLSYQRGNKFEVLKTRTPLKMVTDVPTLEWKVKANSLKAKVQSYNLVPGAESGLGGDKRESSYLARPASRSCLSMLS